MKFSTKAHIQALSLLRRAALGEAAQRTLHLLQSVAVLRLVLGGLDGRGPRRRGARGRGARRRREVTVTMARRRRRRTAAAAPRPSCGLGRSARALRGALRVVPREALLPGRALLFTRQDLVRVSQLLGDACLALLGVQ